MAAVHDIEQAIMDAKAHGIEGVTIKLALSMVLDPAQTVPMDCYVNDRGAAAATYRALCDLTGTDLAAEANRIENELWA